MFPDRRIRAPGLRQPFRGIGLRFPPAPSLRLPAASPICFFPSHKTDFAGRFTARQESRDRSEGRRPYEKSGRSVPRVDVHSQSAAALFAHFDLVAGAQRVVAVAKRPFRARYEASVNRPIAYLQKNRTAFGTGQHTVVVDPEPRIVRPPD